MSDTPTPHQVVQVQYPGAEHPVTISATALESYKARGFEVVGEPVPAEPDLASTTPAVPAAPIATPKGDGKEG
jgi:hypothetical protein